MHDIERELIKVTGYKVQRKFSDRQDYLKSLFNAVQKLTDDDFDNLSDDAATWANACVEAHNNKRDGDIPDFDEVDPTEEDDEVDETETEESDDPEDEAADEDEDVDDESEKVSADETNDEAETEVEAEDDSDQIEMNLRVEKPTKEAKPKTTKPTKVTKKAVTKKGPKTISEEDVVLDKWGCMEGSKNSQALAMFEKGATAAEVKNTIGGTYYNILGKMTKQGHKLTKAGSLIKLTHMSEKESRVSSPKKSKK